MADPDPARPTPSNLSDVDCRHRNGVSHPKRNFHFCAFGCCLRVGSADQDSSWNNATVHCHGDVILGRFFHMSFKNPRHFGLLRAAAPLIRPSRTRAPYLENRLSNSFESLRDSFAYPILFSKGSRCFCIWRGGGSVSCQSSVVGCQLMRARRFASGSNSDP
jgi:hypothetical protein